MTGSDLLLDFLLPPAGLVYLLLAGLLLSPWRRLSRPLFVIAALLLLVTGLPVLGQSLQGRLAQGAPVYDPASGGLAAVLVPTGGIMSVGEGIWWPNGTSVARTLEGRRWALALGLPMILSGGSLAEGEPAEAAVTAQVLGLEKRGPSAIRVRLETAARNSAETAANLQPLLVQGSNRLLLVTSPAHRLRMAAVLRRAGFTVFQPPDPPLDPEAEAGSGGLWRVVLPSNSGYRATRAALYEVAGILWYWATDRLDPEDLTWTTP